LIERLNYLRPSGEFFSIFLLEADKLNKTDRQRASLSVFSLLQISIYLQKENQYKSKYTGKYLGAMGKGTRKCLTSPWRPEF